MTNLSISQAWNESAAFLKREGRLLFPVAFVLIALPGLLLQLTMPESVEGQPPEAGIWLLIAPLAILFGIIGTLALCFLALRPGASVGEALQTGLRRFLPFLAAVLLIGIAAMIAISPLAMMAGVGAAPGEANAGAALLSFILILAFLVLWVRLMPMTSVAAVEPLGPIAIIKRSWSLTRGNFWRLLGFGVLLFVAAVILMIAISTVAGLLIVLVAGPPEPQSLSWVLLGIVSAFIQAVLSAVLAVVTARIYVQLSGSGATTTPV